MFTKDLNYPPAYSIKPVPVARLLAAFSEINPLGYHQTACSILQITEGAQLWVSKEVSDDLQVSEIPPDDIKFEEVEWPHHRLEVYFEDRSLPTFLAAKFTNKQLLESLKRLMKKDHLDVQPAKGDTDPDEPFIHLQAELERGPTCSVAYKTHDIDRMAAGDDLPPCESHGLPGNGKMSAEEDDKFREIMILFYKVLLFAGSEGHTIRRTMDKPTRAQGGKPGFKNRPKTQRLIVEYLPRHRVEKVKAASEEKGKHEFRGRRGHFRVYKAERYKQMRGKRQYIYPVPGPDGTVPRHLFVVRK